MTTIRFNDTKTAQSFARFARRFRYASRRANDVTVSALPHEAERLVKRWALRRGALPTFVIVDF